MAQNNYMIKFQSNRKISSQVFQNINIRPDILKYLAGSFKTPRRGKKNNTQPDHQNSRPGIWNIQPNVLGNNTIQNVLFSLGNFHGFLLLIYCKFMLL